LGAAEPRYVLQLPGLVENCVGLYVPSLEFNHTANQDTAGFLPLKHNMLALLHAPQPRANFITLPTERGIIGKELATIFKPADIAVSLDFAPCAKGIKADVE
jgi:hypothetical protein